MIARPGVVLAGLGLLLLLCVVADQALLPPGAYGDLPTDASWRDVVCRLAAGAVYLGAVTLVLRRPIPRAALLLAVGVALIVRVMLLVMPPVMSTDLYRYVWDGKVQAAGINPYLYVPADPALTALRDGRTGPSAIFANINRPETAPTIYPPAAQILFAAIGRLAPSIWTVKAVMTALDLLTLLFAWRLLRAAARPDAFVLIWAWNPLVIWEFSGAGHIDAAAVAASGLALLLAVKRRPGASGAALGVAILSKLLPAALAPAIWRPRGWRAPLAALLMVAAGYACYASAGPRVFGYLPGYAEEEGLEAGSGFLLLRLIGAVWPLPGWAGPAYAVAALLLLALLSLWIVTRPGPPRADVIARDALLLTVALLITLSPHYPWYLAAVALPATIVPRFGALWLTVAGPLLYEDFALGSTFWAAVVFLPAMAWLMIELRRGSADA